MSPHCPVIQEDSKEGSEKTERRAESDGKEEAKSIPKETKQPKWILSKN